MLRPPGDTHRPGPRAPAPDRKKCARARTSCTPGPGATGWRQPRTQEARAGAHFYLRSRGHTDRGPTIDETPEDPPQDPSGDPVRDWITRAIRAHPDPETERHATDEAISAIHRRADAHSVEALIELIGHEIRTPLALIQGSARMLLKEEDRLDGDQLDAVRRMHRNAVLATLLVDRLAEVRRVDEEDVLLDLRSGELVRFLRETVDLLHEAVLGTRPVDVEADGLDVAVCEFDPRRVRQIVFNLLASAALNTPPGAPVKITVRRTGDAYEVAVRDHGHAVTPEDVDTLFEKFPRLDAVRQGPGIGLYVSKGLARAHGGDLEAVPTEGDGGIFVLRLPAADA